MVQSINAATGWNASLFELMKSGERGSMIARAFNSREGFTIKDDRLPERLFDPKPDGPNAGRKIFYKRRFQPRPCGFSRNDGCDPETGRPQHGQVDGAGTGMGGGVACEVQFTNNQ